MLSSKIFQHFLATIPRKLRRAQQKQTHAKVTQDTLGTTNYLAKYEAKYLSKKG